MDWSSLVGVVLGFALGWLATGRQLTESAQNRARDERAAIVVHFATASEAYWLAARSVVAFGQQHVMKAGALGRIEERRIEAERDRELTRREAADAQMRVRIFVPELAEAADTLVTLAANLPTDRDALKARVEERIAARSAFEAEARAVLDLPSRPVGAWRRLIHYAKR